MDDRITRLIAKRETHCVLKKQDRRLTSWWRDRLNEYNKLMNRPDCSSPAVLSVGDRLYSMLQFVALPNNEARKITLIKRDWPALSEQVRALTDGGSDTYTAPGDMFWL